MNQTYGSQPSFSNYKLYIFVFIGVLVGGAVVAIFFSGNKSCTDSSSQQKSATLGQQSDAIINVLTSQQVKKSDGNANESEISGGNADESSSQQSKNNPVCSAGTGGLFTENNTESNTANSSAQKSENEPPKYYFRTDKNPILDQIASGNTAGFQAAIQSNPNRIIHALYLAMENTMLYPNVSTDCFLQLLENYKSGSELSFLYFGAIGTISLFFFIKTRDRQNMECFNTQF